MEKKKEFLFGDNKLLVVRSSNSGYVDTGDFNATIRQLEALSATRSRSMAQAARDLGQNEYTVRNSLRELRERNRVDNRKPSVSALREIAQRQELLSPMTIAGIKAIVDEDLAPPRLQARVRRNRAQTLLYREE